jgi:hypothetical protein
MRSYKKCKTKSQAELQEKEWKTTKRNGRQEAGTEDNKLESTRDRCSVQRIYLQQEKPTLGTWYQDPQRVTQIDRKLSWTAPGTQAPNLNFGLADRT